MTTTRTEYLLDTNACIAIRQLMARQLPSQAENLRKIEAFRARWQQVDAKALAMSLITLGELEFGAAKSRAADAREKLAALRAEVAVLVPDHTVAARYGEVRHALESAGQKIGPNDTWIAAHGLASERTVVTDNAGEFGRIPGLKFENWTV
jgi:tRNA(fMet)-specific endonuclease VapC